MPSSKNDTRAISAISDSPRDSLGKASSSEKDHEKIKEAILEKKQKEEPVQKSHAITSLFKRRKRHNPDDIATQPSVYDDPVQGQYFQPNPKYENLHRFDPTETWTWKEEEVYNIIKRLNL